MRRLSEEVYIVQHYSVMRKRWATVGEFKVEHYAVAAAQTYDGIMRVLCSNSVAKVPVYACVNVKGDCIKLW